MVKVNHSSRIRWFISVTLKKTRSMLVDTEKHICVFLESPTCLWLPWLTAASVHCVATFYTHTDLGMGETAQWHREDHQEYWNALIGCFQPIQVIWGNTRTRADRSGNSSSHAPQCGVQPASQVWPDSLICDSLSLEIDPSLKFEHFFSSQVQIQSLLCRPQFAEHCMTDLSLKKAATSSASA